MTLPCHLLVFWSNGNVFDNLQKLEDLVSRLRVAEGTLTAAQNRATSAETRYETLLADLNNMQAELKSTRGCTNGSTLSEDEIDALFKEFHESQTKEYNAIRDEIDNLSKKISEIEDVPRPVPVALQEQVSKLHAEVESLHEETIDMVKDFEALSSNAREVESIKRDLEDKMLKAIDSLEVELTDDVAHQLSQLSPPSLDDFRDRVAVMIREVSMDVVEETFADRVAELKREWQSHASTASATTGVPGLGVTEEALELVIVEALTVELREHREEMRRALEGAKKECNAESTATSIRPDHALRGAGGRVVHRQTSATYSPSEADERRRSNYETPPGVDEQSQRNSLRSTVSGLLTGAIGHMEDALGGDRPNRVGLFETGVGGPNEAISQDLALGSCWAMQVC